MNTFHQEPRFDCRNMALCGIHSLSKCRRYKGRLSECAGCTLVRRKAKTLNYVEPGKKICPHCGRELNISMFYLRRIYRNGETYTYRTARCKLCTSYDRRLMYKKKIFEHEKGRTCKTGSPVETHGIFMRPHSHSSHT